MLGLMSFDLGILKQALCINDINSHVCVDTNTKIKAMAHCWNYGHLKHLT